MGLLSKLFGIESPKKDCPAKAKTNGARRNNITCVGYSLIWKNPSSGLMKRVYVVAESTAPVEEVQRKSGLLPPYEIEGNDPASYTGPTERQLAYAQKIGLSFPDDATSQDASVFLTRYEEKRPLYAPPTPDKIVRLLIEKGIELPAYAGVYEASNLYLHNVDLEERIAFFALRVYCSLYGKRYCLLEDAPKAERERFYEFARKYQGDNAFVRSVFYYTGEDLPLDSCAISKKLKAYDIAAEYFKG